MIYGLLLVWSAAGLTDYLDPFMGEGDQIIVWALLLVAVYLDRIYRRLEE